MRALATLRPAYPSQPRRRTDADDSDDALMTAARDGDGAAVDILIRRHRSQVFGHAMKLLRDSALASDVTQDVFIDLMRSLRSYAPRGSFRGFLYRITINRCRMELRSGRCHTNGLRSCSRSEAVAAPDLDLERDVERALARLSPAQREVIRLRFWIGLKHDEIAELLELPVGTVKSRLLAALETLRHTVLSW